MVQLMDEKLKNDTRKDSAVELNLLTESRLEAPTEECTQEQPKTAEETSDSNKREIDAVERDMPLTDDVRCGFWFFKGTFFQRFANQTTYVILYGLVGCVLSMTYAYFNGTLTTLEKRFKIPSKNTGIISIGNNLTQMSVSAMLSYYASKGHRPRWIGFGIMTFVGFCVLNASPHFLYGPGKDALALTAEFGGVVNENTTQGVLEKQRAKELCRDRSNETACALEEGNFAPQAVLFLAQVVSGIGGGLYYTLGISYMDDNTKKSKTPALLSLSYFFHMLGPAIGYSLASFCLRVYIAPQLKPLINNKDPRWLGAWWMGWLLLGSALFISGLIFSMLPQELPRAKARRLVEERKRREANASKADASEEPVVAKASLRDMVVTFKRLAMNKTLICNNISSIFYYFGYTPYWIFTPKYIEVQYRQSAATSSMVTGTVALAFSALGVLISGFVISRFKPSARYMAAWNVLVGLLSVAGCIAYAYIGCPGNEQSMVVNIPASGPNSVSTCNSACYCDYVPFSPVCGQNNMTYISPCHAGCRRSITDDSGAKTFTDCGCISRAATTSNHVKRSFLESLNIKESEFFISSNNTIIEATTIKALITESITNDVPATSSTTTKTREELSSSFGGYATPGACPVNCFKQFVLFLSVMCLLKFIGATGRASNFLVTVRCVSEQDKAAAMGFGMMLACMLSFIPAPIFFGWLLDSMCLVWGKTCSNKGNCWLYDPLAMRYILNLTAGAFIFIGTVFDGGVWFLVKNLKIFDEEKQNTEEGTKEENDVMLFEEKD
ncbi:solute carrier organic anion transporter family member 74D-like [Bactrocera neohumeralis]|uniref:solute carrier organic anion transporter family member 74D-like n=1 Tax=Bactrocera neohumeralis TaxID=98809 RepID=UPI0021666DEF|nr:solute carrier organic anion transporter family member 74D-like [Bactrocera neohumeralis]